VVFSRDGDFPIRPGSQRSGRIFGAVPARFQKFGQEWADRVKWFLKEADANGNGAIEEGEWKSAIAKLQ